MTQNINYEGKIVLIRSLSGEPLPAIVHGRGNKYTTFSFVHHEEDIYKFKNNTVLSKPFDTVEEALAVKELMMDIVVETYAQKRRRIQGERELAAIEREYEDYGYDI